MGAGGEWTDTAPSGVDAGRQGWEPKGGLSDRAICQSSCHQWTGCRSRERPLPTKSWSAVQKEVQVRKTIQRGLAAILIAVAGVTLSACGEGEDVEVGEGQEGEAESEQEGEDD